MGNMLQPETDPAADLLADEALCGCIALSIFLEFSNSWYE